MANYLPVLLVSVNANSIPDDNALTTMPCGQVDYLSHDWQEEDVWRSWRNMTRQKNEITNGLRLENASWRTWWKQRNKLKTVSPETLNWLKDSDVTWLYGPLHTAVDWAPPPKPDPVPDSVDSGTPPSTTDRLDLHAVPSTVRYPQQPRTKPILKHRSISELLTSELPISPMFSPQESEDDSRPSLSDAASSTSKRPCLPYTKSDTHITRWGPSRAFRRDSPPRVIPPTSSDKRQSSGRASGAVRSSLSQDSTSSTSASGSTERPAKKKHISFNTFVEQCIAIDKHPRKRSRRRAGFGLGDFGDYGVAELEYDEDEDEERLEDDDGYEEDREDNFFDEDDPLWLATHGGAHPRRRHLNGSAIHSDSDSDDGAIEIRPSAYRHSNLATPHPKKKPTPRSKSVSSSSSATTTTTSSSATSSTGFRQRRKSASAATNGIHLPNLLSGPTATSAYRPRSMHPSQQDPPYHDRVTIAPIAPTFLKTTGAWEEGFGDEGGASDDGLWDYGVPMHDINDRSGVSDERSGKYEEDPGSDGTPVELVYVPPFGSIYGYEAATYWRSRRGEVEDLEDKEEDEIAVMEGVKSQLTPLAQEEEETLKKKNIPAKATEQNTPIPSSIPSEPSAPVSISPVPVVVIDSSADSDSTPSESFEKNDSRSTSSNSTSTSATPVPVPSRRFQPEEEERGRGRGRGLSVSPVGNADSSGSKPAATSSSSSSNGALLTSRGRSQSCQDLQNFYGASVATTSLQGGERRGRSSMRGPSNGSGSYHGMNSSRSSHSSQSHSGGRSGGSVSPNVNVSTSPIGGSLSPDGSDARLGGMGSAYANGRMGGRERARVERVSSSSSLSSKAVSVSDERRGRDRGRRDIGSGSGSSISPMAGSATSSPEETRERGRNGSTRGGRASLSPQDIVDIEAAPISSSPSALAAGVISEEEKVKSKEPVVLVESAINDINGVTDTGAQTMEMDASICSVSSEGSTATIVPASNVVSLTSKAFQATTPAFPSTSNSRELQLEIEALEEAERWKSVSTPSNSPIISMTTPRAAQSARSSSTPTLSADYSPKHVRTASSSSTHSQNATPSSSKYKAKSPPPILPSPPHPAPPSTSSPHTPGEVSPSGIFASYWRNASTSLERASSGSRERQSPSSASWNTTYPGSGLRKEVAPDLEHERELAEARRGRNIAVGTPSRDSSGDMDANVSLMGLKEPTSPGGVDGPTRERDTIIDRAVGMVSNARAYLRLWPNQAAGDVAQ